MKCPNCGNEMVESKAGHLCISCGHIETSTAKADAAPAVISTGKDAHDQMRAAADPAAPAGDKPTGDKPADDKVADDKPATDAPADDAAPADAAAATDETADTTPATDNKPVADEASDTDPAA
jgi:uncharacterized Zn finger protein (UPF0148 family)